MTQQELRLCRKVALRVVLQQVFETRATLLRSLRRLECEREPFRGQVRTFGLALADSVSDTRRETLAGGLDAVFERIVRLSTSITSTTS